MDRQHFDTDAMLGGTGPVSEWRSLLYESYDLGELSRIWRKFFHLGTARSYAKGSVILAGGEPTDKLYFIDQGEVRIVRTLFDGREKILFRLHENMLCCEVPFFDILPALSSVVAGTDCRVYCFDRKTVFEKIFPNNPVLIISTMRAMASKIRMLCNQSVELTTSEVTTRICRFICQRLKSATRQGTRKGHAVCVIPALTQQDLSSLLGVHRVTLNKALRELENKGIIGPYSRKELFVLDEKRLFELADPGQQ